MPRVLWVRVMDKVFEAYVEDNTQEDNLLMHCNEDGTEIAHTRRQFSADVAVGRIKILREGKDGTDGKMTA